MQMPANAQANYHILYSCEFSELAFRRKRLSRRSLYARSDRSCDLQTKRSYSNAAKSTRPNGNSDCASTYSIARKRGSIKIQGISVRR